MPNIVEQLHISANILLSNFHYYKGDLNLYDLYEMDWSKLEHLSGQETDFFIRITELVKQRGMQFPDISSQLITHFTSQGKISGYSRRTTYLKIGCTSYLKCLRPLGQRERRSRPEVSKWYTT